MQMDQVSVFRKAITPWYDSDAVCFVTAAVMFMVFLFALDGIKVAWRNPEYQEFVWVPALIASLSIIVCTLKITRCIIRRFKQH
jgi:hypothetical protein